MRSVFASITLLTLIAAAADAQRKGPGHREWTHCCQTPMEFGVRGGYDFDADAGLAGAQFRIPLVEHLVLLPSADVFFEDDDAVHETQWQINGDIALAPGQLGGIYLGTGVAFVSRDLDREDDEVEVGYNLFAGLQGHSLFEARVRPFVETRWTRVGDYTPFRLMVGINVPVR